MTILLVDDDPEDQYIFIEATDQLADIAVVTAGNGLEAIELLSGNLLPDIIFLDLNMPKMDGLDFLRANVGARYFNGPIVVLSTSTYRVEMEECLRLGAARVYSKPASIEELEKIVLEVLEMPLVLSELV
jgi:CheY-like chemotaxis protein